MTGFYPFPGFIDWILKYAHTHAASHGFFKLIIFVALMSERYFFFFFVGIEYRKGLFLLFFFFCWWRNADFYIFLGNYFWIIFFSLDASSFFFDYLNDWCYRYLNFKTEERKKCFNKNGKNMANGIKSLNSICEAECISDNTNIMEIFMFHFGVTNIIICCLIGWKGICCCCCSFKKKKIFKNAFCIHK